jgi:hypothetical protein
MGSDPSQVKPKNIKFVFVASPLSTQHGVRAKIGWLGIRLMCMSGAKCLKNMQLSVLVY